MSTSVRTLDPAGQGANGSPVTPPAGRPSDPHEREVGDLLKGTLSPAVIAAAGAEARAIQNVRADWDDAVAAPTGKDFEDDRAMFARHRRKARRGTRIALWRSRGDERVGARGRSRIARSRVRIEVRAELGREKLQRLSDAVARLAAQVFWRAVALTLFISPAVIALLVGSVQVHDATTELFAVQSGTLPFFLFYGLEGLASLMMAGFMVVDGTEPADDDDAGPRRFLDRFKQSEFVSQKWLLLAVETVINVGPRLLLGQWQAAMGMALIPAALVLSLTTVPRVNRIFMRRIRQASMDAHLEAPAGRFFGAQAKNFKLFVLAARHLAAGTFPCALDPETGLPTTAHQTRKGLLALHGGKNVSQPTADFVFSGLVAAHQMGDLERPAE